MTNYVQMERDFIERTLKIVDQYENHRLELPKDEQYEATLLLNCLLGLLVYPQQIATKRKNQRVFNDWLTNEYVVNVGSEWGIERGNLKNAGHKYSGEEIKPKRLTVRQLVRQMRNTVAHAAFFVDDSTEKIDRIVFKDGTRATGFHLELSIESVEKFVRKLAESALERIKDTRKK